MQKATNVRETLKKLPTMPKSEVAELWQRCFGTPPDSRLRVELMRPVLAYRVQEQANGRGVKETLRRLHQTSDSFRCDTRTISEARARFKPGTKIIREWKGKVHEVLISADGYFYAGKTYRSLSPIATEITGTKWSGPAFFGTKRKDATQ